MSLAEHNNLGIGRRFAKVRSMFFFIKKKESSGLFANAPCEDSCINSPEEYMEKGCVEVIGRLFFLKKMEMLIY